MVVTLLITLVSVAYITTFYIASQKNIEHYHEQFVQSVNLTIRQAQHKLIDEYTMYAKLFTTKPDFMESYANVNREAMHRIGKPYYDAILENSDNHLKVFHFYDTEITSILRFQAPKKFGDNNKLTRPILVKAIADNQTMSGFEMGKFGLFYRIEIPLYNQKQPLGVLDIGLELTAFNEYLQNLYNIKMVVLVNKEYLSQYTPATKPKSNETYFVYHDDLNVDNIDAIVALKPDSPFIHNQHRYLIHQHEILDVEHKPIARVFYFNDITEIHEHQSEAFFQVVFFSIIAILLVYGVLYFVFKTFLRKIDNYQRSILESNEALSTQNKELGVAYQNIERLYEENDHAYEELTNSNAQLVNTNQQLQKILVEKGSLERTLEQTNRNLIEEVQTQISQLRAKDKLLIDQSRSAAMGEMVSSIAHQWRQPLNALSLHKDLMIEEYYEGELDNEKVERFNLKATDLIAHMSKTIDDFRNFFAPAKEKESFAVSAILEQSLNLVSAKTEKHNIRVTIQSNTTATLFGYKNELIQVLLNIFNNAVDAINKNSPNEGWIGVFVEEVGEDITIAIEDNGKGIPESVLPHIFEPYYTTKFQDQGTGLGLYMSKMIVETNMGGKLTASNTELGVRFEISIMKESL